MYDVLYVHMLWHAQQTATPVQVLKHRAVMQSWCSYIHKHKVLPARDSAVATVYFCIARMQADCRQAYDEHTYFAASQCALW